MMKMVLCRLLLGLLVLNVALASPRRFARQVELDNYDVDVDLDNFDLDNDLDYYGIGEPQIEIGTLAPDEDNYPAPGASLEEEEEEEQQREKERQNKKKIPTKPQLIPSGSGEPGVLMGPDTQGEEELLPTPQPTPQEGAGEIVESGESGLPDTDLETETETQGMPTCLLCTCLGGSVYCDDVKLVHVPPLPKDTTHFYARYNKIAKINKSDFANMNKLKRIDLTNNAISKIDDGALFGLPALEELIIRENKVAQLPALPPTMTLVDASHNKLGSTGIQNEAFKDMTQLLYLYLTDNNIDHIPVPLPDSLRSLHLQNNNIQIIHEDTFCNLNDLNYIRNALEDVRLDGNPINLSRTPQAYVCLPRIPVGALI
ncbi:epiphycan [Salminus brasiliensis]|uniref:epiphycan n=1 Tax=Salminus brasiliensis TaxID=930266 RepID=UPI003B839FA2